MLRYYASISPLRYLSDSTQRILFRHAVRGPLHDLAARQMHQDPLRLEFAKVLRVVRFPISMQLWPHTIAIAIGTAILRITYARRQSVPSPPEASTSEPRDLHVYSKPTRALAACCHPNPQLESLTLCTNRCHDKDQQHQGLKTPTQRTEKTIQAT